ncbi:MAG: 30S ribosomal protein S8 [Candidatus Woesebacteria bacterium GW2011_GWB1_43_14]|uniref:Small ribosomal subunit protein uS8 n=1 Tax=Candidatus Woesebacteria bacterium GW2011_GWB1_43_14 TaxID=1618578 RepID=A0A0G1DHP3_9BACT|nr:MAG: 30S ribosomal protein S8 [Candidatus Woesebacteria bacterium GW2011_GWA1_39_11b]KKS78030.1 MAG: 30S ribosomal protein S8 [Candidatus Woesebacteria bacterium GW2011_GWC1_42_9]KKS97390.1 MAG: 30S ribosomal protein S8 [Candidatus Woesebacteria bacterium GW2011_GWB1_43_14]
MINYPIGDSLIRIKNAALVGNREVSLEVSNFIHKTVLALKRAGYLSNVVKNKDGLLVEIAYHKKSPLLTDLKIWSKPGQRKYLDVKALSGKKGISVFILSTPLGILSSKEALKKKVGGEVIAEIW